MTDIAGKGFLQNYTHNLKVVGSNPTPATYDINMLAALVGGFFCFGAMLAKFLRNVKKAVFPHGRFT